MSISARLQITPAADRRGWTRRRLSLVSSLQATEGDVIIHDVSTTGLLIETSVELSILDDLEIELPEVGFTAALVIWSSGKFYGCQFKERISQAAISAALLRSPAARPDQIEPEKAPIKRLEPESFHEDGRLSFANRLRLILGASIVLWALILWAAWSIQRPN
jgi:hypothetical protein